jgi:ferredoxin
MSTLRTLRVHIDHARCVGSGGCVALAPQLFALADGQACVCTADGKQHREAQLAGLSAADADKVSDAAMFCPPEAIQVWDAETGELLFP